MSSWYYFDADTVGADNGAGWYRMDVETDEVLAYIDAPSDPHLLTPAFYAQAAALTDELLERDCVPAEELAVDAWLARG